MAKTTRAMIRKLRREEMKAPYEKVETFPEMEVALTFSFPKSPLGRKSPIRGLIKSVTKALIKVLAATPMMKAIASPITPNV